MLKSIKHSPFVGLQVCKSCSFLLRWIPAKTSSQRKYTRQNIHRSSCAKNSQPSKKIYLAAGHPSMALRMLVLQLCKMQLNTYIFFFFLFWKNNIQTWDPSHKVVPAISACNIILNLTPYSVLTCCGQSRSKSRGEGGGFMKTATWLKHYVFRC